jgi:hypothetical protein
VCSELGDAVHAQQGLRYRDTHGERLALRQRQERLAALRELADSHAARVPVREAAGLLPTVGDAAGDSGWFLGRVDVA